jgi:hypothetical protein
VLGNPGVPAPFLNSLISKGTLLTNSHGDGHDSETNYIMLFSANFQGLGPAFLSPGLQTTNTSITLALGNNGFAPATGAPPAGTALQANGMLDGTGLVPLTTANLGAQLIRHGKSFIGYTEGLPFDGSRDPSQGVNCELLNAQGVCQTIDPTITSVLFPPPASQERTLNRGPWVNWQDTNDANSVINVPSSNTLPAATNLAFKDFPVPTLAIVLPNRIDDGHDPQPNSPTCAATDIACLQSNVNLQIDDSDAWLQKNLAAYAAWAPTHNSLLIVTWDEDDSSFYTNHGPRNVVTFSPAAGDVLTDIDEKTPLGITTGPLGRPVQEVRYVNRIPTILYGAGIKPNFVDGEFVDHCAINRMIEQTEDLPLLSDDPNSTCDVSAQPLSFAFGLMCDVNGDGKVDRTDIAAIMQALNTKVTLGDPRDPLQTGTVTVADARLCANQCTNVGCAP